MFEAALEKVRRSFGLRVHGYVVMPEQVHLLLSESERGESSWLHGRSAWRVD